MFSVANSSKSSHDRFIPLRTDIYVDLNPKQLFAYWNDYPYEDEDFINTAKIRYNQWVYKNLLRSTLLPLQTKVLNFFPPKEFTPRQFISHSQHWPIKPRNKPIIGPPEMILDMPQFDAELSHHVADWSSRNCLATIFEYEVHMWYSDSEFYRTVTNTGKRAQCCVKWAPDGLRFGLSLSFNNIGIWSISDKKITHENACCSRLCQILCLEWLSNDMLISGCTSGKLTIFDSTLKKLRTTYSSRHFEIVNISSSCNKKLIAASSKNATVSVWKIIPKFEHIFTINCDSVVRALAWHPWRASYLAIAHGEVQSKIYIWNVNSCKEVARESTSYRNCSIDALTFNPISGELVASYYIVCNNSACAVICVLTSMDTVIEELNIHFGPILYLLWGNEGNVLASASADENLCLWDFFGKREEGKTQKKVQCRRKKSVFEISIR